MAQEATRFVRSCDATAPIRADYKVYMRYKGQGWEIPVPLTPEEAAEADPTTFLARFEADYAALFGRTVEGMEVEITVWSVNASTESPPSPKALPPPAGDTPAQTGQRALFDAALGRSHSAGIYDRAAFAPGDRIAGPAIVTEEETTVILPASRQARMLSDGCIDITVKGA
jgi:N-methylhydantoinase A